MLKFEQGGGGGGAGGVCILPKMHCEQTIISTRGHRDRPI